MINYCKRRVGAFFDLLSHKKTLRRVLSFSARWQLPWLAARVLVTLPKPLALGLDSPAGQERMRILVLNSGKDEFFRDLEEIFREDDKFELVAWPHYALHSIARAFLHPALKHDKYLTKDPTIEATKINYRKFLYPMWRHHQNHRPVHAVISANFGYCVQRELATVLEEQATPFLIMQKENLNAATEERRRIWYSIYKEGRGKFGGRKILVYNEMESELELSSGVVDAPRLEVVGMPRLDRFHRWRREHAGEVSTSESHVLFFSFSPTDKIPRHAGIASDWGKFCVRTHSAILEFAQAHPDASVTIKTKGTTDQDDELMKLLNSNSNSLPKNLHLISGGDAFELITNSCAVVGFNTTGLIEALALGKPVIVPRFGEANDPQLRKLIIDLGDAVEYADSPRQLQELVTTYASRPLVTPRDLTANVERILKYWVGNDDGEAGRRAYNAISHELMRG